MSDNSVTLKLSGRIDSENSDAVKQDLLVRLEETEADSITFDAEGLTYISSSGLRMLLQIRKAYPDLRMINVHKDVYEILEMTGFTELMTVEKAFHTISVEGCEVIGEGANGKVYRVDRETVVKTYKYEDALPEIRHEQKVARLALILGIPTAISYEVVRVGNSYGSVFELLNAQSFSEILAEDPEKMDWCVREFVRMLRRIHRTQVPEDKLPRIKPVAQGWVSRMKSCLSGEQARKLEAMVDEIPDRDTMIHGDYHTKNIVLSEGEVLMIDMDTLSTGHPIFELAQTYCSFVGFSEVHPQIVEGFLGLDTRTSRAFWKNTLHAYMGIEDEQRVLRVENAVRVLAYVRLIDWSMRHRQPDDEQAGVERKFWLKELTTLLEQVDTLTPEEDRRRRMRLQSLVRPKEAASICEMVLGSSLIRKTDLHMHTTVSDGTDTPEELLANIRGTGIPLFSITDHDSIEGCRLIQDILREGDPHFISGAEFSCEDIKGKYHILGYGFDPASRHMENLTEIGHTYRMRKVRARLDFLKEEFGITFPEEDVSWLYQQNNPGKPHIANLMVKYGFAPSKETAISRYLNKHEFADDHLLPEEAIVGILAAGGIPVLAHPSLGSGRELISGEVLEKRIKTLMEYGLQGIEAYYPRCSWEQNYQLLDLCGQHGLYVTAGSDYHGMNKKAVPGETGLNTAEELPEGFRRFLKDVSYIH